MLWNVSAIETYPVVASDGRVGMVADFIFSDRDWHVPWAVIDTGDWLAGHQVLLPTAKLGKPDAESQSISVGLSRADVENSPVLGPEDGQAADGANAQYGISPYLSAGYLAEYRAPFGTAPFAIAGSQDHLRTRANDAFDSQNPTLRSVRVLHGFHVDSRDGSIGHIEEFIIDDSTWQVRFFVVGTRDWWPGKRVLISPRSLLKIDWQEKVIALDVDRQLVKDAPAYDPQTMMDAGFADAYLKHYRLT
ncbi:PRC-barrel domain-containing protein [Devosia sp.]|uniref:PRC-barrel domain-containing protein n=1 Tax=Devosia sp. TaxID=1871048 RepID=UPI003A8D812B